MAGKCAVAILVGFYMCAGTTRFPRLKPTRLLEARPTPTINCYTFISRNRVAIATNSVLINTYCRGADLS